MKIIDRFKELMVAEEAWEDYKKYYALFDKTERSMEEFLHQTPSDNFVSAAFHWKVTDKSFRYWADIHMKWMRILVNR